MLRVKQRNTFDKDPYLQGKVRKKDPNVRKCQGMLSCKRKRKKRWGDYNMSNNIAGHSVTSLFERWWQICESIIIIIFNIALSPLKFYVSQRCTHTTVCGVGVCKSQWLSVYVSHQKITTILQMKWNNVSKASQSNASQKVKFVKGFLTQVSADSCTVCNLFSPKTFAMSFRMSLLPKYFPVTSTCTINMPTY